MMEFMVRRLQRSVLLFVLASTVSVRVLAQTQAESALHMQMSQAWEVTWERFYLPQVQTFGDYLSSYEKGKEQAHLPTAEEVKRQYPNPCGYSTGMEDGAILGGAMLSVLCDRFAVTGEESLRENAASVFAGLKRCVTVHGMRGFVARNVCPEDGTSVYINSSRDQVTHFVHGLWQYYHSPLPDEAVKQQIRVVLADVAERMISSSSLVRSRSPDSAREMSVSWSSRENWSGSCARVAMGRRILSGRFYTDGGRDSSAPSGIIAKPDDIRVSTCAPRRANPMIASGQSVEPPRIVARPSRGMSGESG